MDNRKELEKRLEQYAIFLGLKCIFPKKNQIYDNLYAVSILSSDEKDILECIYAGPSLKHAIRLREKMKINGKNTILYPISANNGGVMSKDTYLNKERYCEVILHESIHNIPNLELPYSLEEAIATFIGEKASDDFLVSEGIRKEHLKRYNYVYTSLGNVPLKKDYEIVKIAFFKSNFSVREFIDLIKILPKNYEECKDYLLNRIWE